MLYDAFAYRYLAICTELTTYSEKNILLITNCKGQWNEEYEWLTDLHIKFSDKSHFIWFHMLTNVYG